MHSGRDLSVIAISAVVVALSGAIIFTLAHPVVEAQVTKKAVTIIADSVNVRATANGKLLGVQSAGASGVVKEGPVYSGSTWWWSIDFSSGVDGWSEQEFLSFDTATSKPSTQSTAAASTASSASYAMNDRISVVSGPLNVRSAANGTILGKQTAGVTGVVVGGPTRGGAYWWWKVDFDSGVDGWTAQNFISKSSGLPVTIPAQVMAPKPTPAPSNSVTTLKDTVEVSSGPLNIRANANGTIIGKQVAGVKGIVSGGPITVGGYRWWQVNYESGADGWSAEPFLTPLPKEVAAAPATSPAPIAPITPIAPILPLFSNLAIPTTSSIDTSPPTTPAGPSLSVVSDSQINLSWTSVSDNVGVSSYRIYRNGAFIGTATLGTSYQDSGLAPATSYWYSVQAVDTSYNWSSQSPSASATTKAAVVAQAPVPLPTPAPTTPAPSPTYTPGTPSNINSLKIAEVGHSLVNTTMPAYLVDIAQKKGKGITMNVQIINGAPLELQWNDHGSAQRSGWAENPYYMDLREGLASASPPHDVLVVTERVAVAEVIQWHDAVNVAKKWRDLAVQYNPNARIYMYTTWVGVATPGWWQDVPNRAVWRTRTEVDGGLFEGLVRDANALITSGPEYQIIPGHRAMMALYDAIQSGTINWAPGGINHFFSDDIHLNNIGNYYIALVHYATIYKESPVGAAVPSELSSSLTSAQAQQLQQMAWTAVSQYSLSGVSH